MYRKYMVIYTILIFVVGCTIKPMTFEEKAASTYTRYSNNPYEREAGRINFSYDINYALAGFNGQSEVSFLLPSGDYFSLRENGDAIKKDDEAYKQFLGVYRALNPSLFFGLASMGLSAKHAPSTLTLKKNKPQTQGWDEITRSLPFVTMPTVNYYKFIDVSNDESLTPFYDEAEELRRILYPDELCWPPGWTEELQFAKANNMAFMPDYVEMQYYCPSPVYSGAQKYGDVGTPFHVVGIKVLRILPEKSKAVVMLTSKCASGIPKEDSNYIDTSVCGEPLAKKQESLLASKAMKPLSEGWVRLITHPKAEDRSVMTVNVSHNGKEKNYPAMPIFSDIYIEFLKTLK